MVFRGGLKRSVPARQRENTRGRGLNAKDRKCEPNTGRRIKNPESRPSRTYMKPIF